VSSTLVTGGAGFIGSHIAERLARDGHDVLILDNLTGTGARNRAARLADESGIRASDGDIRDPEVCRAACAGAEFVFHLAAEPSVQRSVEDPAACVAINVLGTVNMLMAARDAGTVRRFVFSSTCAVYGDTPEPAKREGGSVAPITPYATSKLAGEHFCRNAWDLYGLETVALRYFNVYGPGQDPNGAYAAVIPKFITSIVRGETPIIYGDGAQSRDFIYVGDVVAANLKAMTAAVSAAGRAFNIGSGRRATINDLIEKLEKAVGARIAVERRPERAGDIKHSLADVTAAAEWLGFTPEMSLEEGLARSLQAYRA
jgi:nucleoside-diphosphate-sugar epimerase